MDLKWPASRAEVAEVQRVRKRAAVEAALRAPFYLERLRHINLDRLDDDAEWQKIPLLSKDQLREISPDSFESMFCIQSRSAVVEYWRSGGVTGRPLFYPRSAADMECALLSFARAWALIDARPGDCAHISFPLGIHPVGHLFARSAEQHGIATVWCGSGGGTPTEMQIELIQELKPTIWAGMASYGLHLANVAESRGFDLASSSVKKIIVAAEPLSPAKREKLEAMWGAEVFDHFGMTEGAFVAGESADHEGLHVWSDLFLLEVVDETTGKPVPEGDVGSLVLTPLFNNTVTPFLRWSSGDLVSIRSHGAKSGRWSVFPVMKHARRTVGFFKVRGVNINHSELEDLMFRNSEVSEFKAEACASETGLDVLHVSVELKPGREQQSASSLIAQDIQAKFSITPRITVVERGTLGREFEASVKAPRFIDRRG